MPGCFRLYSWCGTAIFHADSNAWVHNSATFESVRVSLPSQVLTSLILMRTSRPTVSWIVEETGPNRLSAEVVQRFVRLRAE